MVVRNELSNTDERILLFLADQMRRRGTRVLESTGLPDVAIEQDIVKSASNFSTSLAKLRYCKLIESVKAGRVALYEITKKGQEAIQEIIDKDAEETRRDTLVGNVVNALEKTNNGDGDSMNMKTSLQDQLKAGMEQGKLPSIYASYTAPAGVALPKKGQYTEDVEGLQALYRDRINGKAEQNELERIREWFEKLNVAGHPAFHWMQEAICKTSTKVRTEQRNIAYVLGILKSWTKYGYGTDLNAEQRKLFDKFEDRFGYTLSQDARQKLISLVDSHGIVDTLSSIFITEFAAVDISKLIVDQVEQTLSKLEEESA